MPPAKPGAKLWADWRNGISVTCRAQRNGLSVTNHGRRNGLSVTGEPG